MPTEPSPERRRGIYRRGIYPRLPWWTECGWSSDRNPRQPCGRPTVDGIQCARHAKIALRSLLDDPASAGRENTHG